MMLDRMIVTAFRDACLRQAAARRGAEDALMAGRTDDRRVRRLPSDPVVRETTIALLDDIAADLTAVLGGHVAEGAR